MGLHHITLYTPYFLLKTQGVELEKYFEILCYSVTSSRWVRRLVEKYRGGSITNKAHEMMNTAGRVLICSRPKVFSMSRRGNANQDLLQEHTLLKSDAFRLRE